MKKLINWTLVCLLIIGLTASSFAANTPTTTRPAATGSTTTTTTPATTATGRATASHVKIELVDIVSEPVTRTKDGQTQMGTKFDFNMVITELSGLPTNLLKYDFNVTNNNGQLFPSTKSYDKPLQVGPFKVGKTKGSYTFWGNDDKERSGSAEITFYCRDDDGTEFKATSGQIPLELVVYVLVDVKKRSVIMKTDIIRLNGNLADAALIDKAGFKNKVVAESFDAKSMNLIWVLTPFRLVDETNINAASPLKSSDPVDKMLGLYPKAVQYSAGGSSYYIDWASLTIFVVADGKVTGIGLR